MIDEFLKLNSTQGRMTLQGNEIYWLVTIVLLFSPQISGVFIEVPLPLNVTARQHAQFTCKHSTADTIAWRVNDTSLRNLPDFPATIIISEFNGTLASNLSIEAHLEYNETRVDCLAFFFYLPGVTESSPTVTLRIQGTLQAIMNFNIAINSNELKLSWEHPFSLDLTNIDPDIIYCVQVVNITCANNTNLFGNCTIKEKKLALAGYSQYHIYEFVITPRSNVEGAMNGTPLMTQVEFAKYRVTHLNVCFEDVMFAAHVQFSMIEIISASFQTKPSSYSLLLVSNDGISEETSIYKAVIDEMNGNLVELGVKPLPRRRRWNYTVISYDCSQHPLTNTAELSTHDIQNILIYSPTSGEIQVSGVLVQGATAVGLLIIVYPLEHTDQNVYYFEALETIITSTITASLSGIPAGQYGVSVFILEDNGLPFNRSVSTPKKIIVLDGKAIMEPEMSIEYKVIQTPSSGVCVECSFLDNLAEYCVVIIHEKILYNDVSQCELNLTNIDASLKIARSRSGDTGYGCVQDVNLTNHQVGVIGGRLVPLLQTPTTDSTCAYCGTLTVGIVTLIMLIGVLIIVTMIWRFKKRARSAPVTETQEPEEAVHYQILPATRLDMGIEDNIRTTLTVVDNSGLPSYEEVTAQSNFPGVECFGENQQTDSQTTIPFMLKNLIKVLLPVADKWKDLGEILCVTENILDEIFTNNEAHEACLREMLRYYMMRSDLHRDWKEISSALRKLGEETLANNIDQGQFLSEELLQDSEPSEIVSAMPESTSSHEAHDDLAIHMSNQEIEDHPTPSDTQVVFLSESGFPMQKTRVQASSSDDHSWKKLTYPIPESVQWSDPSKSLCIHIQHDDQREKEQDSISGSDTSHDSSSCVHVSGSVYPNKDYHKKYRSRQIVRNSKDLPQQTHEYVMPSIQAHRHIYSDSEEWHHTILCEPEGACTSTLQSNVRTQSYTCTAEPDDVRDDLHSELCIDCEPELSSTGQGVLNEHTCMSLVTPSHSLMDSQNYTVQDEISSLSATQHSFQRHQQSISPSEHSIVEYTDTC